MAAEIGETYKDRWHDVSDPVAPDWSVKPKQTNRGQKNDVIDQIDTRQGRRAETQPLLPETPDPEPSAPITPIPEAPEIDQQVQKKPGADSQSVGSLDQIPPAIDTAEDSPRRNAITDPGEAPIAAAMPNASEEPLALNQQPDSGSESARWVKGSPSLGTWRIQKGDKVRDLLAQWSSRQGLGFDWRSADSYSTASSMVIEGTFDDAVNTLLTRGFGPTPPLKAQIEMNQAQGTKTLVVLDR